MIQMLSTYFESYFGDFRSDESGQGMVEYGLILALVSVVAIVALDAIGLQLDVVFDGILTELGGAATP